MIKAFIPKESSEFETRVAAIPETVKRMVKAGLEVLIEKGAGLNAYISDKDYESAGARIISDVRKLWSEADIVLKVASPVDESQRENELGLMKERAILIGFLTPHKVEIAGELAKARVSAFAMELIPRITRAQPMDALSSQANIAGYKAVLLGANRLSRFFPQLMTAAGTIRPSKVVIIGAGVAGLQAIATARRLGAVVEASDIRPQVKEEVQSLGAKFIELPQLPPDTGDGVYAKEVSEDYLKKQHETILARITDANVVITTASVPGKPAPRLITEEMVKKMHPGSVIVDISVDQGGNCELSEFNKEVVKHGVTIIGYSNLPVRLAADASMLYSRNVIALLELIIKDGEINLDMEDEIIKNTLLTHDGEILHKPTAEALKETQKL